MLTLALLLLSVTDTQSDMLAEGNRVRAVNYVLPVKSSPELMRLAQEHADFLADNGYEGGNGNGHDFGHGHVKVRAQQCGFTGTLTAPNPGRDNLVLGDIIACGQRNVPEAFEDWRTSKAGHWKALLAPSFNVGGFGHAKSRRGQNIWVAVYGRE
jgi:uncharacterized protein YkwD